MAFRPKIGDKLVFNSETYRFTQHPAAKGMPYGQTGRRATVYQVLDSQNVAHAFKVFTLAFRKEQIAKNVKALNQFAKLPGLEAAHRYVLTQTTDGELLSDHPDLHYAALMPWVDGMTWQEIVLNRQELSVGQSLSLAQSLAGILAVMENMEIAHCDLSGPNVMIQLDAGTRVVLVDLEDLYSEDLIEPERKPSGSDGYAHQTAHKGLWNTHADRFAGAVLIAEMLGWCDPRVRDEAYGEQYFDPGEIQQATQRFSLLVKVLEERWGKDVVSLFKKAWNSKTLKGCPPLVDWQTILQIISKQQIVAYEQHIQELYDSSDLIYASQVAEEAYSLDPDGIAKLWLPILMRLGGEAEDAKKHRLALRYFEQAKDLSPSGSLRIELDRILRRLSTAERRQRETRSANRAVERIPERMPSEKTKASAGGLNLGAIALISAVGIWLISMMSSSRPATVSLNQPQNGGGQQSSFSTAAPIISFTSTATLSRVTATPRNLATPTLKNLVTATSRTSGANSSCPGAPPQRLQVDRDAVVCTRADSVYLRDGPNRSFAVIRRAPPGTIVEVIGGPSCANNWSWWEVELPSGFTGWMAEGGDATDPYFLCPDR